MEMQENKGYIYSLDATTLREQLIEMGRNDTKRFALPVQIMSKNIFLKFAGQLCSDHFVVKWLMPSKVAKRKNLRQ